MLLGCIILMIKYMYFTTNNIVALPLNYYTSKTIIILIKYRAVEILGKFKITRNRYVYKNYYETSN